MKSDNPIRSRADDALDRAPAAARFADQVLSADSSEGLVVGVLGPWGTGKTSFVNLARPTFKERGAIVLDYNPWMFSGADQLVASFFAELSDQLKVRPGLSEIGQSIGEYGAALEGFGWLPIVGAWIERGRAFSKLISTATKKRTDGVGALRGRLIDKLGDVEHPVVVVLDDIDRLSTDEIRDVFKLVRLTASFPNIIYLVAFDRGRVEAALTDGAVLGRDYLEKILQIAVDLPSIRDASLRAEALRSLEEASAGVDWIDSSDKESWPDVWEEIVRPLLRHMRDVRRYSLGARASVRLFEGKLALSDVFGLEAVRTFMPDVFAMLPSSADTLTSTSDHFDQHDTEADRPVIEALLNAAGPNRAIAESMIRRLFPAAKRFLQNTSYPSSWRRNWQQHRRVAHIDHLRFYLEQFEGPGLSTFNSTSTAFSLMSDGPAFASYMRTHAPIDRLDILHSLLDFADAFQDQHVRSALPYIANAVAELPETKPGFFDIPSGFIVESLLKRLLSALPSDEERWDVVEQVWPAVFDHGGRYRLIKSLSREATEESDQLTSVPGREAQLRSRWRQEVRAASPKDLSLEPEVLRTVWAAQRDESDVIEWSVPDSRDLTLALLRASERRQSVQQFDSRVRRFSATLRWDHLLAVFGSPDEVATRVDSVRSELSESNFELLKLLDKYIAGWRPNDDDDDD
jgi:hypothetical protein